MKFRAFLHSLFVSIVIGAGLVQMAYSPSAQAMTVRQQTSHQALLENAKPLLWEVRHPEHPKQLLYVFGTIHLMPKEMKWRTGPVHKAVTNSTRYVFEIDTAAIKEQVATQQALFRHGIYHDPNDSLQKALGDDDYSKVLAVAKKFKLNEAQLQRMRPWLASVTIGREFVIKHNMDPKYGVENILTRIAEMRDISVSGLETPDEQIGQFGKIPDNVQKVMLMEALDQMEAGLKYVEKISEAWARGDHQLFHKEHLEQILSQKNGPLFVKLLIVDRNKLWIPRIESYFRKPGISFVAVGTMHVIGEDGVPELLKRKGYKVKLIQGR